MTICIVAYSFKKWSICFCYALNGSPNRPCNLAFDLDAKRWHVISVAPQKTQI